MLVLLLAAGLAGADAPAEIQTARISSLQGVVEILPPGARDWRRANARERVRPGARLRTGAGAWAILELSSRNLVRLGARTEIALDTASVLRNRAPGRTLLRRRDAYRFSLSLPHGSLSNVLGRLGEGGRYELVTPIATAGVRGTEFGATVEPPPGGAAGTFRVTFGVTEGEIEVAGGILPDPVLVRQGMMLVLDGAPGRSLPAPPVPGPTPEGTVVGPGAFVGDPNQSQFDAIRSSQGSEGGQHQY